MQYVINVKSIVYILHKFEMFYLTSALSNLFVSAFAVSYETGSEDNPWNHWGTCLTKTWPGETCCRACLTIWPYNATLWLKQEDTKVMPVTQLNINQFSEFCVYNSSHRRQVFPDSQLHC